MVSQAGKLMGQHGAAERRGARADPLFPASLTLCSFALTLVLAGAFLVPVQLSKASRKLFAEKD